MVRHQHQVRVVVFDYIGRAPFSDKIIGEKRIAGRIGGGMQMPWLFAGQTVFDGLTHQPGQRYTLAFGLLLGPGIQRR